MKMDIILEKLVVNTVQQQEGWFDSVVLRHFVVLVVLQTYLLTLSTYLQVLIQ